MCERVRCPVLVIHGDEDELRPHAQGAALADVTGGSLVTVAGGGHGTNARDPILVNHLIRDFVEKVQPATTGGRGCERCDGRSGRCTSRRRSGSDTPAAMWRSPPSCAATTLTCRSTGSPSIPSPSSCARTASESIRRRAWLANESRHVEDEAGEHDLHVFQSIRRMDEILVNNFTVFEDVVEDEHYDVVIGDESWDIDYFLHENPELKRFAFAWMTDFVGWLPMPDGGDAEAALTADYNAEMIEQRARFRRIRDRSIFIGDPDDIVPATFGPALPEIREWTMANYEFAGYVTGFDPADVADREALRAELGFQPGEQVCVVSVGGSGVGGDLIRRVVDAAPAARRLVDGLRFVVVTGPRLDRREFPRRKGVSYRSYVPDLHRYFAACDLAIVQGGLTTCMELTASRRPFIYVPLRHHFEQQFHVHHRLQRYGAGAASTTTRPPTPTVSPR